MGWGGIYFLLFIAFCGAAHSMGAKPVDAKISAALASSTRVLQDELVGELACKDLQFGSWPASTKFHAGAFSEEKHMPLKNFSTLLLGHCWSMARAQRLFFYLARVEQGRKISREDLFKILDQIRSVHPIALADATLSEYDIEPEIFPIDSWPLSQSKVWQTLWTGVESTFSAKRSIYTELIRSQQLQFFRWKNIPLIVSDGARTRVANEKTILALHNSLRSGQLPLVVLRRSRMSQHVLLLKRMEYGLGEIRILAYDSNYPEKDQVLSYRNGHFYYDSYVGDGEAALPAGIFLTDNSEMEAIQQSLVRHYIKRCLQ